MRNFLFMDLFQGNMCSGVSQNMCWRLCWSVSISMLFSLLMLISVVMLNAKCHAHLPVAVVVNSWIDNSLW